ncbi:unnamed protein product [Lota lota]
MDGDSVKKMLRSVLLSSKEGVPIGRLQTDYRSLCGEQIPHRRLGYPGLEDFLRSIPSVVRLEHRMGEMRCFAAVCKETRHISEMVARQRTSKKSGCSQLVNCRMRSKPSNPYMLNVKPRSCLRQPSLGGSSGWLSARPQHYFGHGRLSASADYRYLSSSSSPCPVSEAPPQQASLRPYWPEVYNPELVQRRLSDVLSKHCSGLWLSKLPGVYLEMFSQTIPPQALHQLDTWTHICLVENLNSTNRTDRLLYPPLHPKPTPDRPSVYPSTLPSLKPASPSTLTSPKPAFPSTLPSPKLASPSTTSSPKPSLPSTIYTSLPSPKPAFLFTSLPSPKPSSSFSSFTSLPSPNPSSSFTSSPSLPSPKESSTSFTSLPSLRPASPSNSFTMSKQPSVLGPAPVSPGSPLTSPTFLFPPPSAESSPVKVSASLRSPSDTPGSAPNMLTAVSNASGSAHTSPAVCTLSPELQVRLRELLSKYTHGLWIHALPKLFLDTYKMAFPEAILAQLSQLQDVCCVEYPIPHDRSKAIVYEQRKAESQRAEPCCAPPPASGVQVLGVQALPSLTLPTEQYPSVLVADAQGSNRVTVRYVGEDYSKAQESMENAMLAFYTQSPSPDTVSSPAIGQLAAVIGEAGDELARVQVIEVMTSDKIKVYYVDYGFSMEVSSSSLFVLHQDFLALPFQAITVQLAGLEAWSSKPVVLSVLDRLAVGRIMLMETVEACHQGETPPLVVLYDTSQDDDLNINVACRKALQDSAAQDHAPLIVSSRYQDVWVTNVSSDGTLSCQLPCRGRSSLSGLLAQIETFFSSQVTSECLVSQPFSGKLCLARHSGKWSRAEISNLHGSRVMDILFIDLGVSSSVEVTELREFPPPFLTDLTVIPAQAMRCVLADLDRPSGAWSPAALLWIRQTVLNTPCSMKVEEVQQSSDGAVVQVSLFFGSEDQEEQSLNQQLARSGLLGQRQEEQNNHQLLQDAGDLSSLVEKLSLNGPSVSPMLPQAQPEAGDSLCKLAPVKLPPVGQKHLLMPPLVKLPQAGQNMDVYVPVACHPGHFVVLPWQDMNKLVVLMGEMVLYYNQSQTSSTTPLLHKEHVYAAKVDNDWHRVLLKGVLSTGLVSVYELDYGRYELVSSSQLRPLIPEFRQLPFQAVTAQLAGVPHGGWSEEASMVFRNHVEKHALVAQVESVHEGSEAGSGEVSERRLTVFLVDTSEEDNDVWIHNIMIDLLDERRDTSTT